MERQELIEVLKAKQDLKYKAFHEKIANDLDPETILGVRIPELRKLAAQFYKTGKSDEILAMEPYYYEEKQIHSFLISKIKDPEKALKEANRLLPYANSWCITDTLKVPALLKDKEQYLQMIQSWISSKEIYTVRFGILNLMQNFLKEDWSADILKLALMSDVDAYMVKMMKAWFLAEALLYHEEDILHLFENKTLDKWTQNKAIQKARESRRINPELKIKLLEYKM